MGAYAHLIFPPRSASGSHTRDLALIDAYDALVYREQEFIGLEKYGKMFHNRMWFTGDVHKVTCTHLYHTAYHD